MKLSSISLIAVTLAAITGCAIATPVLLHARASQLQSDNIRDLKDVAKKASMASKHADTAAYYVPDSEKRPIWRKTAASLRLSSLDADKKLKEYSHDKSIGVVFQESRMQKDKQFIVGLDHKAKKTTMVGQEVVNNHYYHHGGSGPPYKAGVVLGLYKKEH